MEWNRVSRGLCGADYSILSAVLSFVLPESCIVDSFEISVLMIPTVESKKHWQTRVYERIAPGSYCVLQLGGFLHLQHSFARWHWTGRRLELTRAIRHIKQPDLGQTSRHVNLLCMTPLMRTLVFLLSVFSSAHSQQWQTVMSYEKSNEPCGFCGYS